MLGLMLELLEIYGCPWISMESMTALGSQGSQISIDVHGYPWISMDIHAYPWISMDILKHPTLRAAFLQVSSELSYRRGLDRPPFNGRVLHQNTLASGMGGPERIARAEIQEGKLRVFAAHFSGPKIGPFFGLLFQATRRVTHCSAPKAERVHHGIEKHEARRRILC